MATLDAAQVESKLRELSHNGQIFAVEFIKRTTGELRQMRCRFNVSKGVKGVGRRYEPNAKNLIGVYDVENDGHRMINVDGLRSISVGGETYTIK